MGMAGPRERARHRIGSPVLRGLAILALGCSYLSQLSVSFVSGLAGPTAPCRFQRAGGPRAASGIQLSAAAKKQVPSKAEVAPKAQATKAAAKTTTEAAAPKAATNKVESKAVVAPKGKAEPKTKAVAKTTTEAAASKPAKKAIALKTTKKAAAPKAVKAAVAETTAKKSAKKPSIIARGVRRNYLVFKGTKEKTVGGNTKADIMKNKWGRYVSKKKHEIGMKNPWIAAVMAARKALKITGFKIIGGQSEAGKKLYAKAKSFF